MTKHRIVACLSLCMMVYWVSCGQNFSEEDVEGALREKQLKPMVGQQVAPPIVSQLAQPEGDRTSLGGISVVVPAGWTVGTPSSSMRLAEYTLPHGDGESTLAVFRFGPGQGGSVEANIDRWIGQFQQPDGSDARTRAQTWKEQISGMPVHLLDISGTYSVGAMSGRSGQPEERYRMVGAIAEANSGMFVFKLTGPQASIETWKASFMGYIQSIQAE